MDQILVDNREFFIHHVHSTLPLILVVFSRLDRGIQSATWMLPLKRGAGVFHIVLTAPPAFVDKRLADALVSFTSSLPLSQFRYPATLSPFYALSIAQSASHPSVWTSVRLDVCHTASTLCLKKCVNFGKL